MGTEQREEGGWGSGAMGAGWAEAEEAAKETEEVWPRGMGVEEVKEV